MIYDMNEAELLLLRDMASRQKSAHLLRDYALSDQLRKELMNAGAWPPEQGWHPVSESPDHRAKRLADRI